MADGLVLSLFPGLGFFDRAFEEEGYTVVRGPDLLWGGDVRDFDPPPGRFDGVIGGPPCQAFSRMRHMVEANGWETAPNLIPEFERVTAAARPAWFVMENVPAAPTPTVPGYSVRETLVDDAAVGGLTSRTRRFSFGFYGAPRRVAVETLALFPPPHPAVVGDPRARPVRRGGSGKEKPEHTLRRAPASEMLERQGFPPELLDDSPLTAAGKKTAIGNAVPYAMGRAVVRALEEALSHE